MGEHDEQRRNDQDDEGGQVSEVASLGDADQPIEDSQGVAGNVDEKGAPDVEAGPDAAPDCNEERQQD